MGFGSQHHGTATFGTTEQAGLDVAETLAVSEGLTASVPLEVEAAVSLSKTLVKLDFTGFVDPDHASNFNAGNYTIAGLSVLSAGPLGVSKSVILQTTTQFHTTYTVVANPAAGQIQGVGGDELNPSFNTATFLGDETPATFTAVAQSRSKIRLSFSQPMLFDSAFTNLANLLLTSLSGQGVALDDVAQLGGSGTKFELVLAEELTPFTFYTLQVKSSIRTQTGDVVYPDTTLVQWQEVIPKPIRLAIDGFTGEVKTGILGNPDGQIFFSPSYGASAPNSVIEVDRVSVCTRARDIYTVPTLPDPQILYTFPAPSGTSALIGAAGGVLRASAAGLGLATMEVHDVRSDTFAAVTDGPAAGTLEEPIDITRASFLNDARWRIFPGTGGSLGAFRTADNLTPIGSGPTVGPFPIP